MIKVSLRNQPIILTNNFFQKNGHENVGLIFDIQTLGIRVKAIQNLSDLYDCLFVTWYCLGLNFSVQHIGRTVFCSSVAHFARMIQWQICNFAFLEQILVLPTYSSSMK